jgi:hypothetical protein
VRSFAIDEASQIIASGAAGRSESELVFIFMPASTLVDALIEPSWQVIVI